MKIALIALIVILILGMAGYVFLGNQKQSSSFSSNIPVSTSLTTPVKDFAPSMPMNQKTTILIQTSDSSDIKYIVPTDQVETYVKSLPEGYKVISKTH